MPPVPSGAIATPPKSTMSGDGPSIAATEEMLARAEAGSTRAARSKASSGRTEANLWTGAPPSHRLLRDEHISATSGRESGVAMKRTRLLLLAAGTLAAATYPTAAHAQSKVLMSGSTSVYPLTAD